MAKYRKKPVVIEATQLTREIIEASVFDDGPLPDGVIQSACSCHPGRRELFSISLRVVTIHERSTPVVEGDWIITEPGGKHHYPCKPDIFDATYDDAHAPQERYRVIYRGAAGQEVVGGTMPWREAFGHALAAQDGFIRVDPA